MNGIGKWMFGAAMFIGGYFVGFYEMKYKLYKAVVDGIAKKEREEREERED